VRAHPEATRARGRPRELTQCPHSCVSAGCPLWPSLSPLACWERRAPLPTRAVQAVWRRTSRGACCRGAHAPRPRMTTTSEPGTRFCASWRLRGRTSTAGSRRATTRCPTVTSLTPTSLSRRGSAPRLWRARGPRRRAAASSGRTTTLAAQWHSRGSWACGSRRRVSSRGRASPLCSARLCVAPRWAVGAVGEGAGRRRPLFSPIRQPSPTLPRSPHRTPRAPRPARLRVSPN